MTKREQDLVDALKRYLEFTHRESMKSRHQCDPVQAAHEWLRANDVVNAAAPEREVCGYRVRWTLDGEECAERYSVNGRWYCYCRASDLLLNGCTNVRIRKLTRPVRDKSTGGGAR